MSTVELLQKLPTPQRDHVNVYTCAVLAVAEADNKTDAQTAAEGEANTASGNLLTQTRANLTCPAGTVGPGTSGGPNQPTTTTAFSHFDVANNRWVAYATSDWKATLECAGAPTDAPLNLPAEAKDRRYNSSSAANAPCDTTSVYSGCVIAHALGATASKAKKNATTKAMELLATALREARRHKCPEDCDPGLASESNPDNSVEEILNTKVNQAAGSPFISYVRVPWIRTVWCPSETSMREPRRTDGVPA